MQAVIALNSSLQAQTTETVLPAPHSANSASERVRVSAGGGVGNRQGKSLTGDGDLARFERGGFHALQEVLLFIP